MRIVFLSSDDEYAGAMQKYLYESHPDRIVASVVSSCMIYRKKLLQSVVTLWKASGFRYPLEMARIKLLRRLNPNRPYAIPSALAASDGVEIFRCADINAPEAVSRLARWKPDLIISTNFNQYIGRSVRTLPTVGTWNLHKSLLPEYRGMAPAFHALLDGKRIAGATLHVVDKGIDTGAVLARTEVPVGPEDTVFSLSLRIADAGGRMLVSFLEKTVSGSDGTIRLDATPQPSGPFRSYTYPDRTELRLFRKKGLRFI